MTADWQMSHDSDNSSNMEANPLAPSFREWSSGFFFLSRSQQRPPHGRHKRWTSYHSTEHTTGPAIPHRHPNMGEHLTTVLNIQLDLPYPTDTPTWVNILPQYWTYNWTCHTPQRPPHGWTSYHSTEHTTGPAIPLRDPHMGEHLTTVLDMTGPVIAHRHPNMGEHLTTVLDTWLDQSQPTDTPEWPAQEVNILPQYWMYDWTCHSPQRPQHGWTSYHSTEHMTAPVIAQTPPHGWTSYHSTEHMTGPVIAHRHPRMGEHLTTVLDIWLDLS